MTPIVLTDNLKKDFKSDFRVRTISSLKGISLTVSQGDIFGFVGHNGAGKTTLIKILTGLIRPTSGSAQIMGQPVGDVRTRSRIGFLPERPYFYEFLTARETLHFYGRLAGMKPDQIRDRSTEWIDRLDLTDAADRPLGSYSKGMLQRLGVAQALLHDPELVILDEPMSGLDPVGRGQIKEIIRYLKKAGKTVFFSSHVLADVEQLCDQVALIAWGELRYAGSVESLVSSYQTGVEFLLNDLTDAQRDWLAHQGGTVTPKGRHTAFFIGKDADGNEMLRRLMDEGIQVLQFTPQRPSLEDIFLHQYHEARKGGAS